MAVGLNVLFAIAVLVLIASGLAVIFGLMRVVNFAHGEFVMLGAFVAVMMDQLGWFWAALIIGPLAVGLLAVPIEAFVIRRLYGRPLDTILATWGLSIVIREAMKLLVGPQFQAVDVPLLGTVELLGVEYPAYRLAVILASLSLMIVLAALLRYTRFGLSTRAVIENPTLAMSMGINVRRTYRVSFALGAALAALAGVLISPFVAIHPQMGPSQLVEGFLVVLGGGGGSILGLAASAGVLGGAQSLVVRYVAPIAGGLTIVVLAVVIIRLRPNGILRRT